MGITNNLPTVVADWLEKQFPVRTLEHTSRLVEVLRPVDSTEIERLIDIAHNDMSNRPFEIHVAYPLVTLDGDTFTSYEGEPAFFLIKLGATYKLAFIDITDDAPQTLRVLNYKKFKGITNING